ncbi:MAG: amino acid ABC transporter permease [Clostridia bacterium]
MIDTILSVVENPSAFTAIWEWFLEVLNSFYKAFFYNQRYLIYLEGLGNTLIIALGSCIMGIIIGFLVTYVKIMPQTNLGVKILAKIANLYTTIIRGTPVFVQLLIMYFSILSFMANFWNGIPIAIIVFGLNSGAYVSEIIRGGLLGVDRGQMEAGRSLGLSWGQTMRLVVMPQGIKSSIPSLFNEFIQLVKETSVAGAIAVMDLTKAGQIIVSQMFDTFPPLLITAVIYLIVVLGLQQVQKVLEKKFAKGDRV